MIESISSCDSLHMIGGLTLNAQKKKITRKLMHVNLVIVTFSGS